MVQASLGFYFSPPRRNEAHSIYIVEVQSLGIHKWPPDVNLCLPEPSIILGHAGKEVEKSSPPPRMSSSKKNYPNMSLDWVPFFDSYDILMACWLFHGLGCGFFGVCMFTWDEILGSQCKSAA